jgi:hypothetical protein
VAVCEALKGVDVGAFGVVLPNDLFIGSDLGSDGPGVVEENITVREKLEVVVAGVSVFGSAGFVFPDDGSVGLADREDVFSVGSTDKDEAVFFGEEGEGEKEDEGK